MRDNDGFRRRTRSERVTYSHLDATCRLRSIKVHQREKLKKPGRFFSAENGPVGDRSSLEEFPSVVQERAPFLLARGSARETNATLR